jgi:ketosteroid isomerase-like protein
MTRGDSEVVRRFTAGLRAGDVPGCLELLADDIVFSEPDGLPFGGDYHGKDGFVRLLRAVGRDFRMDLDEPAIGDAGAFVAVRVRGRVTSRATGRWLDLRVVDLYELRDGLITRVDVYYKDPRALTELCRDLAVAVGPSTDDQGGTR